MLDKNLQKLDFDKILNILSTFAIVDKVKSEILNIYPYSSESEVACILQKTNLALDLLYRKGTIPIENFEDPTIILKNLESNNSISANSLLTIASILKTSRNLHNYLYGDSSFDLSSYGILCNIFNKLYQNRTIEDIIFNSIIDENTIADTASPALNKLRKSRKALENEIRNKLNNIIHSSKYSKYLMDNIITIRNDRFVIPVKEEFRSYIPGAILDISSSGSTLYIEPSSIYDLNNKINSLKIEESIEIDRILVYLSSLVFPIVQNINSDVQTIYELDLLFAKAKYSKSIDGILPNINKEKSINLISARHPLINSSCVVPIDFSIGSSYTTLLITGPNTGGKTATLKTVGLLESMACCGILIPAKSGSSIHVFDKIFADIGDEQSIQDSLSTFSSHMLNIIDILNIATDNSLVLLDELGSGTDPEEGSSLAISILEYFHSIGALTVSTTHFPELKKYALVTDGFENASSDFDIVNLKPTYKLLIGVPGKSNAFAISQSLGLSKAILDRAKESLSSDNINIETILKEIYEDKLAIELEKEKIIKNSNQIEMLRKSLERDNTKLNEEANKIISNAKETARNILLETKDEADYIIKELEKDTTSIKQANSIRQHLNKKIKQNYNSNISSNNAPDLLISPNDINIGDLVTVKKINQSATVTSFPNKSGELTVQIGMIKMNVNISDLVLLKHQKDSPLLSKPSKNSITFSNHKSLTATSEINVIGLNVDEAVSIVDKYLDNSSLSNLQSVRIVHGKGTGKLRRGIHEFLKQHPHVKDFRIGSLGEGDTGVTIVNLK